MKNFKQVLLFAFTFHLLSGHLLAVPATSPLSGHDNYPAVTVEGYFLEKGVGQMPLDEFMALTPKKYRHQTGQKLSLKERMVLKFAKKTIKHQLKKGEPLPPVVDLNVAEQNFNWGAFALGFFLGLIGILIVALAFKDKKAWISALVGWGLAIGLILLIITLGNASQV